MPEPKKLVLKVEIHDNKEKKKALRAISGLEGIESINIDTKENKLVVTGDVDPVDVINKLRKYCRTEILTVGPAKEEKKKDEPKKDEKKEDVKKDGVKKDQNEIIKDLVNAYEAYNPYMTKHYSVHSMEENPNSCVIC